MHIDDPLETLRAAALAGDRDAEQRVSAALPSLGPIAAQYANGECAAAWTALVDLGPAARDSDRVREAWGVAWETMFRARRNVEALIPRLAASGYEFMAPERAHVPPNETTREALDEAERLVGGPLPLSLLAFYSVVGSVDLRQAHAQTVHDWLTTTATGLCTLGDDDPLMVAPVEQLNRALRGEDPYGRLIADRCDDQVYFMFAPDCFHKAGVSGGENYHVWLPDAAADFRIVGDVSPGIDESLVGDWFVRVLRQSFEGGGFRGRMDADEPDMPEDRYHWRPRTALHHALAKGLLAV